MKKLMLALIIAALGMFYAGSAEAFTQSTTGTMNIAATVQASCTVATTDMNFGVMDFVALTSATSTITVNCSSGAPYRIDIDHGLNDWNGAATDRYMKAVAAPADGLNTIPYSLSKDASLMTFWGDNGATLCPTCSPAPPTGKSGVGTGLDEIHMVYGSAHRGLIVPDPGIYTDTVMVTVNY